MNNLMPFGTPSDLEAGNLKGHMAGSHAEMIDFSVSIESYIDTRYPELQFNQPIKFMLLYSTWPISGVAMSSESSVNKT